MRDDGDLMPFKTVQRSVRDSVWRQTIAWLAGMALLGLLSVGCLGGQTSSDAERSSASPTPTKECEAYLAAYRACMGRLSPGSPVVAAGRADNARRALASITDATRLRATCVDGLAQLETSCR
jgi:hypothetical protein